MRSLLVGTLLLASGCDCGGTIGTRCDTSTDCSRGQICLEGMCRTPMGTMDAGPGVDANRPPVDGSGGDAGTCAIASGEVASAPVDIIIAVDQSPSTAEEQAAIRDNINTNLVPILEASGLDYRIVLINSNPDLCPPGLCNTADPLANNPPRWYRVEQAVNNSDELTLILWTYDGFTRRPNSCVRNPRPQLGWRNYLRMNALKVFLVFSDDDPESYTAAGGQPACGGTTMPYCNPPPTACPARDCDALEWSTLCPNFNCPTFADRPADWAGGMDFPSELYRLDPPGMFGTAAEPRWVFHSLVGLDRVREPTEPLSNLCDICDFGGNAAVAAGITYQKLSILTGGVRFPSCNTDYSPVFSRIASTIIPLACEFVVEPTTVGTPIDPRRTNVVYQPGDGSAARALLLDSRPCETADGWQWNEDFTRIRLCGSVCDLVQNDPMGHVSISVGCATQCQPSDEFCIADGGT